MQGDTVRYHRLTHLFLVLCLLAVISCDFTDDIAHKRKLEALVQRGASRAEVARELGAHYEFYEKGTPSWDDLQRFLEREPPSALKPVRENVRKFPKVMYYTTMWRMTWVFLDDKDIMRSCYVAAQ